MTEVQQKPSERRNGLTANGMNIMISELEWTPNHWLERPAASAEILIAAAVQPLR